jgi:hypothetical protein
MFWFQFKQKLVFNTIHSYLRCGYIQRLNLIQKSNLIFYNNKLSIHVMIVLDSWLKIDKQIIAKYHVANQFNRNSCDLPKTRRLPMLYSTKKVSILAKHVIRLGKQAQSGFKWKHIILNISSYNQTNTKGHEF